MNNIFKIIKNNLSFIIVIIAILTMIYFGFQLFWPVFNLEQLNPADFSFDKIGSKFK